MTITAFKPHAVARPGPAALVVEPELSRLLFVLSSLSGIGFDATVAETFKEAKAAVLSSRPGLLITGIKLHDYNGLHLVLRARAAWKHLPAIVTSATEDHILRDEAEQLGATLVILPATTESFTAAIARTVFRLETGTATPPRPPFERRQTVRRRDLGGAPSIERRLAERRQDLRTSIRGLSV